MDSSSEKTNDAGSADEPQSTEAMPPVFHWYVGFAVAGAVIGIGAIYWSSQRYPPPENARTSLSEAIASACAAKDNLPGFLKCTAEVRARLVADWYPDWLLIAQQDQALWASLAAIVAAIMIPITAAGVFYVAMTLKNTEAAVAIATAQNEGFRHFQQVQLRPYLSFAEVRIDNLQRGKEPQCFLLVRNFGKTPAYKVGVSVYFELEDTEDHGVVLEKVVFEGVALAPGQSMSSLVKLERRVTDEDWTKLQLGRNLFSVVGTIRYFDVWGEVHTTPFSMETSGLGDGRVIYDPVLNSPT